MAQYDRGWMFQYSSWLHAASFLRSAPKLPPLESLTHCILTASLFTKVRGQKRILGVVNRTNSPLVVDLRQLGKPWFQANYKWHTTLCLPASVAEECSGDAGCLASLEGCRMHEMISQSLNSHELSDIRTVQMPYRLHPLVKALRQGYLSHSSTFVTWEDGHYQLHEQTVIPVGGQEELRYWRNAVQATSFARNMGEHSYKSQIIDPDFEGRKVASERNHRM